ncbi:hypothetical protein P3X46_026978 [Hevea brasiliensis]|uniref:PHD-type domain-containing protein n=1 Tax=Hevea brasiliensis TaxID=3981 RepID=A0ABQ9L0M7_HEVBR|nr:hypothetical protein P3X46_026978 [Hevea brasiliensis]
MQLKSASDSSQKRRDFSPRGTRLRKKHKRLDAICENVYNQNHSESNEGRGESTQDANLELRRSSRVRRAPVVLDVSPPPVKKRRKIGKNVNLSVNRNGGSVSLGSVKREDSERLEDLDTPGSWRSRLRSRGRNVATRERGETSGRRKLFDEIETTESELAGNKGYLDGEKMMVVRSKRPGRVKAVNGLGNEMKAGGTCGLEDVNEKDEGKECIRNDESEKDEIRVAENEAKEGMAVLGSEIGSGNDGEVGGNDADESMEVSVAAMGGGNEVEVVDDGSALLGSDEVNEQEQKEKLHDLELKKTPDGHDNVEYVEQSDKAEDLENGMDLKNEREVVEVDGALVNEVEDPDEEGHAEVNEIPLEVEKDAKADKLNHDLHTLDRPRIKQGRRCGLCGCGNNDGKPPKRLVQDAGESERETYSGSSASEEPNYDVWDGFGDEPGWLGRLLGPINDRYGIAGIWVHQHCAVWSPEVYFAGLGRLKNVRAALCRGRALKCTRCGRPGATIGCRVDRCPKTYHLPCARANGCIFDHRKFLIACTDHRHLFQPHGNQYLMRIKKLKARKMRLEMRKLSNDAWRKDVEAEEKCKRLHRDLLRIAPVYIGGSESEIVILPLLYPEFFSNLGMTPPRGVLLHGHPGTGKTLVVRALIGSCARGDKRIAYFARKGADCLGKYVGDAERQLRLLFQVAERCQPSIIFFDEIDGLAPCRTRQQDQTHSSVVSTLLALLDGLKSRGSVVVIGATNRPEAVDPALRRPGRFDREIYFPLPSVEDRAAILSLHTQRWPKPVTGSLLQWVARRTVGFAGADLQALCTQAAIIALKRNFPLQEILSAAGEKAPGAKRVPLPDFAVEERDWLEALACASPPCSRREAGIAAHDLVSSPLPTHLIPCLLQPLSQLLVSLYLDERLWLPPPLSEAAVMIKRVVISSLAMKNLPTNQWWSHVDNLLQEAELAKEIQKRLSSTGILSGEGTYSGVDAFADENDDDRVMLKPSVVRNGGMSIGLSGSLSFASLKKPGYRVLFAGSPRSGQRQLASCILHCYLGNAEVQKVDLATISQEGHGDMVQGITQILMKCASLESFVIFMPRIDLWAVESCQQVTEESDASSTDHQLSEETEFCSTPIQVVGKENESIAHQCSESEMPQPQDATLCTSHAWSSFVEQVESIRVSTSLIILATSELPYLKLPHRIREFFKSDISNSSQLTPLEHTVPRFLVHTGGNFNRDVVASLSAAKLLRDIIQLFVLLVHQRVHMHIGSSRQYKFCDSIEGSLDAEYHNKNHGSAGENECREEFLYEHLKVPPPPNNRSLKGKSSLLLAISTFGHQILRYPHFAELCWVTSKLKEGPCADVSGPWKGWPFNSCIIRPGNMDSVTFASGNVKSKERSGLVRGLVAIGLSAYRGVYKSLREVSFEVRKVLELLVGQVNEKIQAGKDKYQYVRLLSQVAYLEDMVNNWAHALQSLELDTQITVANARQSTVEFLGNHSCEDHLAQSEECKEGLPNKSSHESECLAGSPMEFVPENEGVELNKGDNGFCHSSSEVIDVLSEDISAQRIVLCGHNNSDKQLQSSTSDNQLVDNNTDEQNETALGQCEPENTETLAVVTGLDNGSSKHSNGFVVTEAVLPSENGLFNSGKPCADKFSGSLISSDQVNRLAAMEGAIRCEDALPDFSDHIGNVNLSPGKYTNTSHSADSGVVCSYICCSGCLCTLHGLIQKILVRYWGLNNSYWVAEDVHDIVSSLSVDLLSAVRKVDMAENINNSFDENLRCGNAERLSECPELRNCHCKSSGNSLALATECSCHSVDGCLTAKGSNSPNSQFGLELEFIFRDGILVPVDSNKDVSFHCKYKTLCLCSLIKSVVMMKQPFD